MQELESVVSLEDTFENFTDSDIDSDIEIENDTELNTESIELESEEIVTDTVSDLSSDDEIIVSESDNDNNDNDVYVVSENVLDTSFDYTGNLETIIEQQSATNELLVRINEQNDFMIALSVTFMFCVVCYKILHGFSKI